MYVCMLLLLLSFGRCPQYKLIIRLLSDELRPRIHDSTILSHIYHFSGGAAENARSRDLCFPAFQSNKYIGRVNESRCRCGRDCQTIVKSHSFLWKFLLGAMNPIQPPRLPHAFTHGLNIHSIVSQLPPGPTFL